MNSRDAEELLARRLAGEDVARGGPRVSYEPVQPVGHPDGDVKIGKSLRVPLALFTHLNVVAERRHMSWSALVRQYVIEGLAREEQASEVDPVVELHHHLDAAARALRALEGQRDAA